MQPHASLKIGTKNVEVTHLLQWRPWRLTLTNKGTSSPCRALLTRHRNRGKNMSQSSMWLCWAQNESKKAWNHTNIMNIVYNFCVQSVQPRGYLYQDWERPRLVCPTSYQNTVFSPPPEPYWYRHKSDHIDTKIGIGAVYKVLCRITKEKVVINKIIPLFLSGFLCFTVSTEASMWVEFASKRLSPELPQYSTKSGTLWGYEVKHYTKHIPVTITCSNSQ